MTVDSILRQYRFNLAYARQLVADVDAERMDHIPAKGLVNHPAFTLGHLVSGSAMMAEDLGLELDLPEGWAELFIRKGPGDPTLPAEAPYPGKTSLLDELERQHGRVEAAVIALDRDALEAPFPWRFSGYMPRMLDLIHFMCVTHEAMHLGQLAAWRRAMDLPSALGAM